MLTVKRGAFKFRSQFADPADALAEARQLGTSTKTTWREHLNPDSAHVPLRPLTPLKIGHMNSVIAAGHQLQRSRSVYGFFRVDRIDGDDHIVWTCLIDMRFGDGRQPFINCFVAKSLIPEQAIHQSLQQDSAMRRREMENGRDAFIQRIRRYLRVP